MLLHPSVEFDRPIKWRSVIGEVNSAKVMDNIAAPDEKNALLT